jgi:glycosyltransferase involved in cell wall biosynthesis
MTQFPFVEAAGPARLPLHSHRQTSAPVILMSVDAVGGVWRYAMELAGALAPGAYRIVFAVLGPRPSARQEVEARQYGEVVWLDEPLDWMVAGAEELSTVGPALCALADRCGADLLHLNAPSQATGMDTGLPVVTVAHSCLPTWWKTVNGTPLPEDWRWHLQTNQAGFDVSGSIVVPSRSHARAVADCYGRGDRFEVVHNGIPSFRHSGERQPMLFAAGRWWDEGKNGKALAVAAPLLGWPVVAAGPLESPGGAQVNMEAVRTLGPVPHDHVLDHMRRAEIVVSPSLYEPFGLAALEGALSGAALLLADIPTYRELWEGAACFFDPLDSADLAAKGCALIDDREMRAACASSASRRARTFTAGRQAEAMDAIYRRHLGRSSVSTSESP